MKALSEIFDKTSVAVPVGHVTSTAGEIVLSGRNLAIVPLTVPWGRGMWRKAAMVPWTIWNAPAILRELIRADAVHAPIPGDVGTIGMLLALACRKPLFVRHCGNWLVQATTAEKFWKWFMERFAGGRNVMLATGGASQAPSARNPNIEWIFATTLRRQALEGCGAPRRLPLQGRLRLITVSRQEREKGTGVILETLPLLLDRYPFVTLDVVGDGGALGAWKLQAQALGLRERVTFYGKVGHEEVIRLLQQADLFCYPTTSSEGFPKVVLEALACGLPVVTTKVSVLPQLIGAGGGVLLQDATATELARGIQECLSDPERYQRMSQVAIQTARSYSLEAWRDSIGKRLRAAWGPLMCEV